jgi:hypothetical protein
VINKAIFLAVEKKERDRQEMIKLFGYLFTNGILSADDFTSGYSNIQTACVLMCSNSFNSALEVIEDVDIDIPFASKYLGTFIGNMMSIDDSIPLSFLQEALQPLIASGKAALIAATALSALVDIKVLSHMPHFITHTLKGESDAVKMYEDAKLDLLSLMKQSQRTPDEYKKFLADKVIHKLIECVLTYVTEADLSYEVVECKDNQF